MHKYFILPVLLFFLSSKNIYSQKNIDPTQEDIQLSKKLKDEYPDDEVAILNFIEDISFNYDKNNSKVTVNFESKQEFISLDSRSKIPVYIFYDNESSVNKPKVLYRNLKSSKKTFNDEYYNSKDLFHTDARIKWASLTFPLPGYKYNFEYTKTYNDIKYFINSYFDDTYPISKKTIRVHVPNWLELEIKEMNFEGVTISKDISKGEITTYTYTIENTSSVINGSDYPGSTHYRPHLLFLAKSHKKNGTKIPLLNSTSDLYAWYHSLVEQLDDDPEIIRKKTLSIIKDCKTDEEKIKAIFYWVQDNIRYIAFEDGIAGFKPDESQNVYQKKYGDCKGMANLTKQMLLIAGFDARLTWIGTKHIAYDYSLPTIAVDNHMICTVILNEEKYFLDSTEKYNPLNHQAERIQNKQVLIEDGDSYILDKVPLFESSENLETITANLYIENELLIGDVSRNYNGESKSSFLYSINNLKSDKREEMLSNYIRGNSNNMTLNNVTVSDITDREADLTITYDIIQKNAINSFDDEMYIDIDYYKEYKNLDLEKRTVSYLFPHKIYEKTLVNIDIPSDYKLKSLPENLHIVTTDFEISFTYKNEDSKIKYEKIIHFKNAQISSNEIESWNKTLKKLKNQYQSQIILSKK